MTIAVQPEADTPGLLTLAETISADYLQRLESIGSPLAMSLELKAERLNRSRHIIEDVLSALSDPPTGPALAAHDADREPAPFSGTGARPSEALEGTVVLFDVALMHLGREFPTRTYDIACFLVRRLLADVAHVLDAVGNQVSPGNLFAREVIDEVQARTFLTRRQLAVFELVSRHANTKEIAAELNISELTVKHHITGIGARLNARGRTAMLTKARELGLLITVPATLSGALTAVSALMGGW